MYNEYSGKDLDLFFESLITESVKPKTSFKVIDKDVYKSKDDTDNIVSSLNKKERKLLCLDDKAEDKVGYMTVEESKKLVVRVFVTVGNTQVAFFDLKDTGKSLNASVVTRNGDEYRNKGYASQAVKKGLSWYNSHKSKLNKPIIWWAEKDNIASQKLAEKCGFKRDLSINKSKDKWIRDNWNKYIYK